MLSKHLYKHYKHVNININITYYAEQRQYGFFFYFERKVISNLQNKTKTFFSNTKSHNSRESFLSCIFVKEIFCYKMLIDKWYYC